MHIKKIIKFLFSGKIFELTLSDVGLGAKDRGVLKCAWIVQINDVVVFRAQNSSCQITFMRGVPLGLKTPCMQLYFFFF